MPIEASDPVLAAKLPDGLLNACGDKPRNATGAPGVLAEVIRLHAEEEHARAEAAGGKPREVCGFVIRKGNKSVAMRAQNVWTPPPGYSGPMQFETDDETTARAEEEGDVICCYHTHPYTSPEPSMADKVAAEKHGVPLLILSWPQESWAYYQPGGFRAPLLGRPFVYGLLDCWTCFRDGFMEYTGIPLPDFDRGEDSDWWHNGGNLFLDHLAECQFSMVTDGLKQWDGILMQIDSPTYPNHAALYLGDGMILHHVQDRISTMHPFIENQGFYAKATYAIVRHATLCENSHRVGTSP